MSDYQERRTKAKRTVNGVQFECWQTGIAQYVWRSTDGTMQVWTSHVRNTYSANVGGEVIGRLYRSEIGAMKAATVALRKRRATP